MLPPCWVREKNFCNTACMGQWQAAHKRGADHPGYKCGRVEISCAQCGKPKLVFPSEVRPQNFCGAVCRSAWQSEHRRGKAHHRYKGNVTVKCAFCGKSKEIKPSKVSPLNFCSMLCKGSWMSANEVGSNGRGYKGGRVEVACAQCAAVMSLFPCRLRYRKRLFCSHTCHGLWMSAHLVGSAHPSYVNGYTCNSRTPEQVAMFKLARSISNAMRQALLKAGESKRRRRWDGMVPYTLQQLRRHLSKTMPPGYTWSDLGGRYGLHIDHIVPISAHRFSSPDDVDFQRCFALRNLRLLPAEQNVRKQAKLLKPFQPSLL
jgi:hypothetical protein